MFRCFDVSNSGKNTISGFWVTLGERAIYLGRYYWEPFHGEVVSRKVFRELSPEEVYYRIKKWHPEGFVFPPERVE